MVEMIFSADSEALHVLPVDLIAFIHVEMAGDKVEFLRCSKMVGILTLQCPFGVCACVLSRRNGRAEGVMLVLVEGCSFTVMFGTLGAELLEFGGREGNLESLDHVFVWVVGEYRVDEYLRRVPKYAGW
jgi:hypothetical protein